jgi:hypothetical protein
VTTTIGTRSTIAHLIVCAFPTRASTLPSADPAPRDRVVRTPHIAGKPHLACSMCEFAF